MKKPEELITTQSQQAMPPTNGNTYLPDGSPRLQPATVERMVNWLGVAQLASA